MKRFLALAATASLALGAIAVLASTGPAGAVGETVTINVSMDLPYLSSGCKLGPIVFQVTDVPVGAGPELTGGSGEITSNPCNWGGAVSVDVDPTTKQISVLGATSNTFQTAVVTVTYPGIGSVTTVSDNTWQIGDGSCNMNPAVTAVQPTGATISWTYDSNCTVDQAAAINSEGSSVFQWGDAAPTTTTTEAPTTTTEAPAVASAAAVAPAFTG